MWTFELAIMLLMIGMNSVFAAYEISLASIGTGRLHSLVDVGKRGSEAAVRMKENIEGSLAVVQLGITLVGVIAAATGGAGAEETFEPMLLGWGVPESVSQIVAIVLVVVPLTVVTIVFGELVPKVFALRNTEWVCLTLSPFMEWFAVSVKPAVWVLENAVSWIMRISGSSSDDAENQTVIKDLHGAAAFARISRLIGQREEGIIMSASRLSSTPVKKILMPAEYIDMLVADQSLSDALLAAHLNMHTRYPVTEESGNAQRIIGYVNFKDIVANMRLAPHLTSFRKLIRSMESFDMDSPISECLERLIRDRSHIALVRDRAGVILGMITLEDIIEELVGEIHDELDRIPTHLIKTGDGWIAGGFVSLSRLREVAGVELPPIGDKPLYTLNDWVFESLGRPPKGGDSVQSDTCNIVVRKTKNVMVQEAFVSTSQTNDGSFINASNRFSRIVLLALLIACSATCFNRSLRAKEPIPEKLVVLTFDDSAKSHFTVVRPLLLTYGFSATFFITEGFDFNENKRDYMTWEEIAQLHQDGFEIGNHTRDHLSINDKNFDKLSEQLEGINQRCAEHDIPKPVSFAWPGNSLAPAGLEVMASAGIRFARRGGAPEFEYERGRGFAYEPMLDHPLLIPSAGDARPDWELDDFVRAIEQAKYGRIAVLQFHGVPDTAHNWVNTPKAKFEQYMRYLAVEGYQVVALRDLEKFVDASVQPKDPMGVIEDRKNIIAKQGEYDDFRMPKNNGELEFWLRNMLVDHHYSLSEISAVTGMSATEIQLAVERLKIDRRYQRIGWKVVCLILWQTTIISFAKADLLALRSIESQRQSDVDADLLPGLEEVRKGDSRVKYFSRIDCDSMGSEPKALAEKLNSFGRLYLNEKHPFMREWWLLGRYHGQFY
jgi:putative hemolysin